jgi:hypothetical protein
MASTFSTTHASAEVTQLSGIERLLLVAPLAGGLVFGLLPLLLPGVLAAWTGYPGNDPYIYALAGAATFGYAVALALGIRQRAWAPVRLLVVAVLTFNLASLYGCAIEIAGGQAQPVVYLILVTSLAFVALCVALLSSRRAAPAGAPDSAPWVVWFLRIATLLAATFGLLPLLVPTLFGTLFGFKATDIFLYRQAGAATLGYAVMGVLELRSRRWEELRLPVLMAGVFNGLSFLASVVALVSGQGGWLVYPVLLASLGVTAASIVALRRNGK